MVPLFACRSSVPAQPTIQSSKPCTFIRTLFLGTSLEVIRTRKQSAPLRSRRISVRISMSEADDIWVKFPYLCDSGRGLMEEVASMVEGQLGFQLNPSSTPADVRSFKNAEGNGEGSVNIRSGKEGSKNPSTSDGTEGEPI
eukprot:Gb_20648 [translate_table: standard]